MEIVRLTHPTALELAAAGQICEMRWPFLRPLHTPERFAALRAMGVELVVAREGTRFDGVCFALPCRHDLADGTVEWVNLFQLATRPETKNIGALMMMRIASLYPTVVSLGVTEDATRMYVALRWKRYDDVWRGVHPVDMKRMAADYGERLHRAWQRRAATALAGTYNTCAGALEAALGAGVPCQPMDPQSVSTAALRDKAALVAGYFALRRAGRRLRFVDADGIGRVLDTYQEGWGGIREHARMWRDLRRRGAKLCEVLATNRAAKNRLVRLGYVPVAMPMWYVEKDGMATRLIAAFQRGEISFFHTDKVI